MSEHLSSETLTRLLARELPPRELLTASRHIAVCPECRQLLGAAKDLNLSTGFLANDLQRSMRAADLHLSYEELESYVDELLPAAERERTVRHLETCASCEHEANELNLFRESLASPPMTQTVAVVPSSKGIFQKLAALFEIRSLQFAGLAVLLLLAVLVGLFLWQRRKQPQLANTPPDNSNHSPENKNAPEEAQREPGPVENDKDGNSNGDAAKSVYDAVVATAIARQTLVPAPGLKDLNGRPVTLLGPGDAAQKFDLLSPRGTVVQSSRPTLRWQALAGAESYEVYVLNPNFDVVLKSGSLSGKSWTVTRALDRGQTYIWQVVATKDGKEITSPAAPAREARFRILDSKSQQAIEHFAQNKPDDPLALGIIYAHHGLLDEAERQLSSAATLKQSPELARKFLREVKAMRR
jgi:hypothetical protein